MKRDRSLLIAVLTTACVTAISGCATTPMGTVHGEMSVVNGAGGYDMSAAAMVELDSLSLGESFTSGDTTFTVGEFYTAASGHRCRTVVPSSGSGSGADVRIACSNNGQGWFFPENIFLTDSERD